ncbi:T9SS type A sorting domain-containing protein [Aureispira anguillae]|uniref:T9SS type A sorting domain-containing protein n=1 Tax=Aureispira anguillae TaxID=2864201 RepID=A0A915YKF8_9BACT|nr:T9SS type A sorting domain-containing protein [Aureispira anguillae]BDS14738.1 T9SS type A sorting domain-containing protein [Aureispira anguillae]
MKTILFIVMACLWHAFASAQTSLTFDGVDDYTHVNYYPQLDLGTGNFTLEAMLSTVDFSLSDTLTLFSQRNQASNQGLRWSLTNNAILLQIGSTSYSINHSFTGCSHLAIVRENGMLLFYADHLLLGTQALAGTVNTTCINCDLWMGKDVDNSDFFKGSLDELRIWDIARSSANIASYELSCLDSTSIALSNLVGYWNFEENTGQFANNLSSVAHYARLGSTFYADSNDPTWTSTSCLSSACYATGLADFTLSDNNPKEGDFVTLHNNSAGGAVAFWCINGDTTLLVNSLQYAFPLGMNIIQLAVNTASGLTVRTLLLDVKRPKYPCGADEYKQWRQVNDPNYALTQQVLSAASLAATNNTPSSGKEYHIPVVFHVIADNQNTLNAFPPTRLQAQLDTLNKYFSKDSTKITFCLAQNLPSIYTLGVSRWEDFGTTATPGAPGMTYTLDTGFTGVFNLSDYDITFAPYNALLFGKLPFPAENYLNVYIVDTIIYAGQSAVGISSIGPTLRVLDGIGIDYDAFVGGAINPLGKTLVHEVGHWMGLEHVFGEDYICDTYHQLNPTSDSSLTNCSTPYSYGTSCPPNPIYNRGENHMDYHLETCRAIFTRGQVARMQHILDNGRPVIHSTLNLIGTGVQQIGGCLDQPAVTAVFNADVEEVCFDYTICLEGANVDYDYWEWGASWNPSKNNGIPAPNINTVVNYDTAIGTNRPPKTFLTISEPGTWDVYLTVEHLDTTNGSSITTTVTDTLQITILDCTQNDQRNRLTAVFDSSDWQINSMSIANLTAIPTDTLEGHIVTGTAFIPNQNDVGVLIRTDLLGRMQWRKSVHIPNADVRLLDLVSEVNYLGQNCVALTGHVTRGSTTELLFLIVNRVGTILFQESYQMNNGGSPLPFQSGLEIIQLSSSFNHQFAIVGLAGAGVKDSMSKTGFIVGIDPSLGIQWQHFFETTSLVATQDYDIAENVVEINGSFGPALVIGGNANRVSSTEGSAVYFSCLTISGSTVTQQWRQNLEAAAGNQGTMQMVATAYDNGRLFGTTRSGLRHGAFTMELDPNTGAIGAKMDVLDLVVSEMIIDGNYCVLSGRQDVRQTLAAVKVALPPVGSTTWSIANASSREYLDSRVRGTWGGVYNYQEALGKRQNMVPSPNGGYMQVAATEMNSTGNPLYLNLMGLIFNKVDDVLVSSCIANKQFDLGFITGGLLITTTSNSVPWNINAGLEVALVDSLNRPCNRLGCKAITTFTPPPFYKCPQDSLLLSSNLFGQGDYSYQWTPTAYLSSDTVFVPITTTPINQVYNLIITDNQTGCQVAEAAYTVLVQDTTYLVASTSKCAQNSITLRNTDLSLFGNYNYQWFPATFLNDPTILEPTCFATSPQVYTLVASSNNPDCKVFVKQYTVHINGSLIEHRINCLPSDSSYFTTPSYPSSSPFHYKMNLNIVLANLGITDTTGIWSNPIPGSFIPFTPPFFDTTTNIITAGVAANIGTLHYTYGNGLCQNRLILHFLPDASINGAARIDVCQEAILTFNANTIDSTIEHSWRIYGQNQPGPGLGSILIRIIPFGDSLSITDTFRYDSTYQFYIVEHRTRLKNCPSTEASIAKVKIYVYPENKTITLDTCTSVLTLATSTPSDTIQWYEVSSGLITGATSHNYQPLTNGSYYATVQTEHCDFTSDTFHYTIPLPIASTASVSSNYNGVDISCYGAADGTATVTVNNGLAPYSYLWSNGDSTAIATDLAAGSYQVSIIDACLDTTIANVTVTEPAALSAIVNPIVQVSCFGVNDGQATAVGSGGTSTYNYLWSNGDTTATATGLVAGTYTLTVTDVNGCLLTTMITITEPSQINHTMTGINPVSCSGVSDGSVTATVTGGTSPYTYLWSNGATNSTVNSLAVGTYYVTITDANSCSKVDSISFTVPPLPLVTLNTTNISCYGFSDGQINTTITGNTAPYGYLWSNGGTNAHLSGLVAGGYSLTITDANGCTVTATTSLTEPSILSNNLVATPVNCLTANSGAVANTVTGGSSPYTYLWSNGATTEDLTGLIAGSYCVTITDANNCTISDCATVAPLISSLSIVKTVDKDTILPYDTVCYRILVTNNCQAPNTVVVTDTLATSLLVTTAGDFNYNSTAHLLTDTLTIAAGATDTLEFKTRVLLMTNCDSIKSILNQANAFELGNPSQQVADDAQIWIQDSFAVNCQPLPDTVYFSDQILAGQLLDNVTAQTNNQTVNMAGVWILDAGTTYSFTNGSTLKMSPGAQIIVAPGATLSLNNTTVQAACPNCLWQSILVQEDATLETDKATLRDAQYAIHAAHNSILRHILNTNFLDNFIGIYVAPGAPHNNIVVGEFDGNLFSAPVILPPFTGLLNTPTLDVSGVLTTVRPDAGGGQGLAGILAWDIPSLNLNLAPASPTNTFQDLVAGIVLFNANFSTNSCHFDRVRPNTIYPANLGYQGCGIYVRAAGNLGLNNILVEDCLFDRCFIGISGTGLGIQAYRNKMTSITDMGVRSLSLFDTKMYVRFNTFSKMGRLGVAAFNPLAPTDIWIDNNQIDMNTRPGEGTGILVNDNPGLATSSSLSISNNIINANDAENGIAVMNHNHSYEQNNAGIKGNTIYMNGSSPERAGITAFNSRLVIECNTITGDANTRNALDTRGIIASGGAILGGGSIYQCNAVTGTNIGVFFEGFNNQVDFKGNRFDDHHIGLLMDAGAVIGNQDYEGNTWTHAASTDAFHQGLPFIQGFSLFDVNAAAISNFDFRPNNYNALSTWFDDNAFGNNSSCEEPFRICGNARSTSSFNNITSGTGTSNQVTNLDQILAKNGGGTIPLVTRHNGKRALFRKLVENPHLATNSQNPHIQNFVANHQNTCIGHFDQITKGCRNVFHLSSMDSILIDSCKNICESYLDSLHYVDSLLVQNYTANLTTTRNAIAHRLSAAMPQQQTLLDNLNRRQQNALMPICANNNAFSTVALYERMEKEVNEIYFNTLAKGILTFSSNERSILRRIAAHCPQEGGLAVHQARGMLSMIEDVILLNFNCPSKNGRSNEGDDPNNDSESSVSDNTAAWNLIVYPNPARNTITLQSNRDLKANTQIEIYNALGQQVKVITTGQIIQTVDIDVSSFVNGVYTIHLKNGEETTTKPFVVIE